MSDHEGDPELQAAFDELSESVGREVDVDSSLAMVRSTSGGPPRVRRPLLIGLAAAVVLLVIAGSAVLWTRNDDGQVVSADGPDVTESTTEDCVGDVAVYLVPSATQDQIDQVGELLEDYDEFHTMRFVDRAETYEEFTHLFADSPEFAQSIDPAELPNSYRLELTPGQFEQVQRLEVMPEVMRIEATGRSSCAGMEVPPSVEQDPVISPEDPRSSEATTTSTTTATVESTSGPAVDRPADLTGALTSATIDPPPGCAARGEFAHTDQSELGCPTRDEELIGTAVVDGVTLLITSETTLLGCGPGDGREPIPYSQVQDSVIAPNASGPANAFVWYVDTGAAESAPVVRAQQLSIGTCG